MLKLAVKRDHPQLMHKMEENLMLDLFVVVDKLLPKCPKMCGCSQRGHRGELLLEELFTSATSLLYVWTL